MKSLVLFLFCLLVVPLSNAQPTNAFEYLKLNEDHLFEEKETDSTQIQVFLLGTFHYRKKFEVKKVRDQVLAFNPKMVFVEEVHPEMEYKSDYKNYLYRRWGDQYYSNAVDSLRKFLGFDSSNIDSIIQGERLNLVKNPNDHFSRMRLINTLLANMDEANANLHLTVLRESLVNKNSEMKDSVWSAFSPYHRKSLMSLQETRYLSAPIAVQSGIDEIHYMDDQAYREENDSVLSITTKKLMPRMLWKVWKLPYMIKMMKLNQNGPQNDEEALKHFKVLNEPKTMLNMAKLNLVYFRNEKIPESIRYNDLYNIRNQSMIEQVVGQINTEKKILIIVGASHVPYFIWELHKQLPNAQLHFLDLDD